jgi:type I restriction enzyme S subunit
LAYGRGLKEDDRESGEVDVYGSNGRVGSHNVALVQGPGILVGRKGTVGAVHYANRAFWPIDTVYYVRPLLGDNQRFLYHLLDYLPLKVLNAATGVPGLSRRDAYALRGVFPPPDEQVAIARILEAVDSALERTRDAIETAESLVDTLTEVAVTGELLTEGMRALKGRVEMHERLGKLPVGWSVLKLATACTRIVDGTHQSVKTAKEGLPFLYVSCVRRGRIAWEKASRISERTYQRISKGREPQRGSVLYTAVGSYGHAAAVSTDMRFSFQRHIAVLYPKENRLLGGYLALWINSQRGKRWSDVHAVGNAQKTVTLTELSKMLVACPPPSVQTELVEIVHRADAVVDAQLARLKALLALKRCLMHDLLTGLVRVREVREAVAS